MSDLIRFAKGQVWLMNVDWTTYERDAGITVGNRPVIIVRSVPTIGDFVTVVPCTSNVYKKNGVELFLEEDKMTKALVQEIKAIPINNLRTFYGNITKDKMDEIDLALMVYFGFNTDPELIEKYFPIKYKNIGGLYNPKHQFAAINETKPKFLDNRRNDSTTIIAQNSSEEKNNPTTTTQKQVSIKKRAPYHRITELTPEQIHLLKNNPPRSIKDQFKCNIKTLYRWKNDVTTDDTYMYNAFKNRSIKNYTDGEKQIFCTLDPEKLAMTLNLSHDSVLTIQEEFRHLIDENN